MLPWISEEAAEMITDLPYVGATINPVGLIYATIAWVLSHPTEFAYPVEEMRPNEYPPGWTYDPETGIFVPPSISTPVIRNCR